MQHAVHTTFDTQKIEFPSVIWSSKKGFRGSQADVAKKNSG